MRAPLPIQATVTAARVNIRDDRLILQAQLALELPMPEDALRLHCAGARHRRRRVFSTETGRWFCTVRHNGIAVCVKMSHYLSLAQWRTGESMQDLISRADIALYGAKQRGRNRVEVAP